MKRIFIGLIACLCSLCSFAQARYVFFFIGDGMGINHIKTTELYLAQNQGRHGIEPLLMTTFPYTGQVYTYSHNKGVTDSSAAGTCLASGTKTNNGTLGRDAQGNDLTSVAEQLHQAGWAIGITATVAVNHATPAAFYGHADKRSEYYTIGSQLPETGYNFFAGAGFYQPNNPNDYSMPNLFELCRTNGYRFVTTHHEALSATAEEKIILMPQSSIDNPDQENGELALAIDRRPTDLSLPQMVDAAIAHLEPNPRFFLMVEGSKIDHASHTNDVKGMMGEMLEFDTAVSLAYQFYLQHPDETLIIVTADHETGGLVPGTGSEEMNLTILNYQHCSKAALSDSIADLKKQYGKKLKWEQVTSLLARQVGLYGAIALSKEDDQHLQKAFKQMMTTSNSDVKTLYKSVNYLAYEAVAILNRKANVNWGTRHHSASTVPVFAIGVGAEQFTGWHDNSEIAPAILKVADFR